MPNRSRIYFQIACNIAILALVGWGYGIWVMVAFVIPLTACSLMAKRMRRFLENNLHA
jgi:hypothetical protein